MEPSSSVKAYLENRYRLALLKKLATLPPTATTPEKEQLLKDFFTRLKEQDRQAVRTHTFRKILALQKRKLDLMKSYLTQKDLKDSQTVTELLRNT